MTSNTIDGLIDTILTNLKSMSDTDVIIGKPIISADNSVIVPITKITLGFLAGGAEYSANTAKKEDLPYAGGGGAGVSITPLGFLISYAGKHSIVKIDKNMEENKWANLINASMNILKKDKEKKN